MLKTDTNKNFSRPGYEHLAAYQLGKIIQDLTVEFCDRFIDKKSRTHDQMVQAARSNPQNVAEGYTAESLKSYIFLTGVAHGSNEELTKDFQDFLRQRNLPIWAKEDSRVLKFRGFRAVWVSQNTLNTPTLPEDSEESANFLLTLCQMEGFLLFKLAESLKKKHVEEGGFTENLYKKRIAYRNSHPTPSNTPKPPKSFPNTILLFFFTILTFFAGVSFASAATPVYYSVGQNTTDHKTGNPTVTVSGTTATFSVAQTVTNMGVGDLVTYAGGTCYISGKTSQTVWSCVSVTGGTPTAVTDASVTSITHAFNSLNTAIAGASDASHLNTYNLVTGDYQLNIPCYYDSGSDTTTAQMVSYTTDATRFIKIYTPTNSTTEVNQSQRHQGTATSGGYVLAPASGAGIDANHAGVQWAIMHLVIDGLVVETINANGISLGSNVAGSYVVKNCIVHTSSASTEWLTGIGAYLSAGKTAYLSNNVVYGFSGSNNFGIVAGLSSAYISNTTLYGNATGIIATTDSTVYAKNVLSYNNSLDFTVYSSGSYDASSANNISKDSSAPGSNSKINQTVSFVDTTNKDFHLLPTDTAAKDAGTDLSADANSPFATDIDGEGRPIGASWDIGADEAEPRQIYYSVGQSVSDLKTGTPSVTIANGAATFTVAQTGNIGVGDRVTYNTSQIAYISAKTNADGMHWSLVTATGALPADITDSAVVSITREFTSLSSAEAAASNATHINNTDLVAANVVLNLPCYYDSGADTTAVTIDGYTTGANNYIKVYTPNNTATEANVSQRHSGKTGNTNYKIDPSVVDSAVTVNENYTQIIGIEITGYSASGQSYLGILSSDTTDVVIAQNLIHDDNSGISSAIGFMGGSAARPKIYNNIIYNTFSGIFTDTWGGPSYVYNNTIGSCNGGFGIRTTSSNIVAKNNLVKSCGDSGAYVGTFSAGTDYNATDGTDNIGTGSNNKISQNFSFVDATNKDFHLLPTDTAARNAGADLSADANLPVTTDIDGQTRNASINAFDIGADESATQIFYSVGQNTTNHMAGAPTVIDIANGTATFSVAQTATNMGVGDQVTYNTSSIAYISEKISTTQWKLITATGATPANVTGQTVNSIAHAYASLSAAEAGAIDATHLNTTDLVAGNYQLNIPCYYDTGADTTAVTIDGYTTGAQNYIKIYTPNNTTTEVNVSQRHKGKEHSGYYMAGTEWNSTIYVSNRNVVIDGIEIDNVGINRMSGVYISVDNVTVSNSLIHDIVTHNGSGIVIGGNNLRIFNNIIYNVTSDNGNGMGDSSYRAGNIIFNNTIINSRVGFNIGWNSLGLLKNNISLNKSYNAAYVDYASGPNMWSASSTNNISSDATAPGLNAKINTTVSFVDATNKDFHLSSTDTAARNSGVDLSADANLSFNTDIDGASRNASINAWDIGADETATQIFRSVAPSATAVLESDTSHARNVTLTSGVATFSNALVDNIGVGDAVLIDTNSDNSITSADTLLFIHSRTSSTVYTLRTYTGATPSDITINDTYQIYRAYTSLANAEAGTKNTSIPITFNGGNRDLVANNEQWNIACYANGTTADTTNVDVEGWNTANQNNLKIYTPTISSEVGISQRHSGKWDEGKYRLETSVQWLPMVNIAKGFIKLDGLQVYNTATANQPSGVRINDINGIAGEFQVSNNIVRLSSSYSYSGQYGITCSAYSRDNDSTKYRIYNNIVLDAFIGINAAPWGGSPNKKSYVFNNTVVNSKNTGIRFFYGTYAGSAGELYLKNNLVQGSNTNYAFYATDSLSVYQYSNNISQDVTSPNGASYQNKTVSFVNTANNDFHLSQSDTAARGAGANLTVDANLPITTDIDGQLRNPSGAGWDIGADEGTVEFTPTVMQTGGDYSTLSSWEAGVQTDLVASTTRVFSHGGKTGTIADNASVTGLTSNATATVVHATTNQILLETISGTFASGETIQVTAGNSVTISDNGNPASAVAKIDGAWTAADTTAVTIDGWNTGADNYVKVYTTPTARHKGKWDDGKYRLEVTNDFVSALYVNVRFFKIDGLQIKLNKTNYVYSVVVADVSPKYTDYSYDISNNIITGTFSGASSAGAGILVYFNYGNNGINKIYNNIIYGLNYNNFGTGISINATENVYVYNNTVYGCYNGIATNYWNIKNPILKNNIAVNNNSDFVLLSGAAFDTSSSNNISSDVTAPGSSGSKINAEVEFVSTEVGNEDFHLAPDDKFAIDAGTSLASDSATAFTTDIDGQTRTGSWDIGADETATVIYRSVGPSATGLLDSDSSHTRNVTLNNGVATFSAGVPDNVGVGDAVLIDTNNDESITSADTLLFIQARNSSTTYQLQTHTGAIPTNITSNDTYQIYRAHTSLANAEAGTINSTLSGLGFTFNGGNRDLVTNNEQWNIACYANGTTADMTGVEINGWNTGAQNFIKVYTPVNLNEVGISQRHIGTWDDAKYKHSVSGGLNVRLYFAYVYLDGLQLENTSSTVTYAGIFSSANNMAGIKISNNIGRSVVNTNNGPNNFIKLSGGGETNLEIWNNIAYGFLGTNGAAVFTLPYTGYIYNNTFFNNYIGIRNDGYSVVVVKNNIVQNCTDGYSGPFDASSNYNISDLAADAPGANSKNLTNVLFMDEANSDFRLSSDDTAAKGAGLNLSADANLSFTDDIRGQSRPKSPDAWSIGACEALDAPKTKLEGTQIKMEGNIKFE